MILVAPTSVGSRHLLRGLASLRFGPGGVGQVGPCPEGEYFDPQRAQCWAESECPAGQHFDGDAGGCVPDELPGEGEPGPAGCETAQEGLSPAAREELEAAGHTIDCHIDPNWFEGAGGCPNMLCSIDGGGYDHGAYAINYAQRAGYLTETVEEELSPGAAPAPGAPGGAPTDGLPGGGHIDTSGAAAGLRPSVPSGSTARRLLDQFIGGDAAGGAGGATSSRSLLLIGALAVGGYLLLKGKK